VDIFLSYIPINIGMRRLGIISCQVFEKELSHLLDQRDDIENIYMTRTPENISFSNCIKKHNVHFIKEPMFLPRLSRTLDVLVNILPIGLHIDIDDLEYECNENINEFKECTSSILLFYGLCGKALSNVIRREDVKLIYPSDEEGIVDDCICSVLGRCAYLDELRRMGSFFMTPGFVLHRNSMLDRINKRSERGYTTSDSKLMLELNDYQRALLIRLGLEDEEYLQRVGLLADELGLSIEKTDGSLDLLRDTLDRGLASVAS